MKKISLIALMLLAILKICAFEKDGMYYNILSLSNLTVELVDIDNSSCTGDVTVPRTVEYMSRTFDVTSISSTAFEGCNINTLSIMDNIKETEKLGFGNVKNLRIEDSDEQLVINNYNYAERVWGNIEHVYIGRGILRTDGYITDDWVHLFGGSSGVQSVEFGPKVTAIPEQLAFECSTLTSVTIPANVKIIGDYAFEGTSLADFNASGVTSVGIGAFRDCKKLKRAEFSQSLNTIEGYAFEGCTALEDFVIPENAHSLRVIDYHAFEGCTSLKSFVIPEGVCYLGEFAFSGCTNLESVKIPNSVYDFGNITGEYDNQIGNVFKGCSALKTIIMGHKIPVKMWENSFSVSKYLSATLKVPAGTKEKYQSADYWKNFFNIEEDATINDNICTVAINRYQDKEMMDDVNLYFYGEVTTDITGSLGEWYNHGSEQNLIVAPRGGQVKISLYPRENYKLTSLTINGEDVTSSVVRNVYTMDFNDNMELTIVPVSEYYRYKTIDTNEATFKEQDDGGFAITKIAENITKYEIPEIINDRYIGECIVNLIENSAFENNTNITSVSIPASITYIADRAFAGCTALEEIYVYNEEPIELTSQGSNSLQLGFSADVTDSGTSGLPVFEGVNKETCILYVPKGSAEKYRNASGWNEFANITEFDVTAIEAVKDNMYNTRVISNFSVDGKRLSQPQKGMNIQRMSDGTTRKIVR